MSFCLKCQRNTDSINDVRTTTKNNKPILKSNCAICGSKKSQFLKHASGKELFNNALSNHGVKLHLPASKGEYVPEGSFNNLNKYFYYIIIGPGTKYEQRDSEGYQGINELDKMRKLHDRFYNDDNDTASRNISDEALAHRASEIADDSRYDDEQRRFAKYVAIVMKNKARFGFGIKAKNVKRGP
jgi:hypothetical protein